MSALLMPLQTHAAEQSTGVATLNEPTVALQVHSLVIIKGRNCQVERRLGDGRWQFLDINDATPRFHTDADLARMMRDGDFFIDGERGLRVFAPPPPSPIAIGPAAHASNLRKHAYVEACFTAPAGLRRSRRTINPIIAGVAAGRNETPPGFTTVLNWIEEYRRFGEVYGTAAYSDRHDLKGHYQPSFDHIAELIQDAVDTWLVIRKKALAYARLVKRVQELDDERGRLIAPTLDPKYLDEDGRLKPPSLRTFERRCAATNRMLRDWAMKGPAYAKQKNLTWDTVKLPDRPYAEVDVDHQTLDIMLTNESGVPLGRPDLIVFRDRATGMVLGRSIGFEQPSYAAFVEGLRHATYPKDLSHNPNIKNGWPCFGRIENLYVDNAFHFIGDNITQAARELNFHVHPLQPASPWLKGALERFFGTANTGLTHLMSGTTLSNTLERKDHEHLGEASLTLGQFEGLLDYWICEIYHASALKALGPIRGLADRPLSMWEDKVTVYRTPQLPHPDIFISLAGDRDTRTIQKNGITWDYITYEDPQLWSLLSNAKHKRREDGGATEYDMVRDPFDLGVISVRSPYTGEILRIPATNAHAEYARGTTLHQHKVFIANARKKRGERVNFEDLKEAKAQLVELALSISKHPGRKKIERSIARFLEVGTTRRLISKVTPGPVSSPPIGLLSFDLEAPSDPRPHQNGSVSADTPSAQSKARHVITEDDDDDLEALRTQKNWSCYNDFQD